MTSHDVWYSILDVDAFKCQGVNVNDDDHDRSMLIIMPFLSQDPDSPKFGAHWSFDNFMSYPKNPNNHNNHHNHNKHNKFKAILSCFNQNKCTQDEF